MKKALRHGFLLALVLSMAFIGLTSSPLFAQGGTGDTAEDVFLAASQQTKVASQTETEQEAAKPRAAQQSEERKAIEARMAEEEIVVRTYSLKYIDWRELVDAARFYLVEWTGSDHTLTVRIRKKNIAEFEAVLKKLDVEKKNILFRVYTIIASRENPPDNIRKPETTQIDNRDLKGVLDELKDLWNFKHYWVEAPSVLTVRDGSGNSYFKLVSSQLDLGMNILHVRLGGEEPGKRMITVGQIQLIRSINTPKGEEKTGLIDTREISFKEKGYLVVGVSGLGPGYNGLALILVISAEIK
jgi:hypothetical protein